VRLIAILLSLWANRHPQHVDRWRQPHWLLRFAAWIETRCTAARLDDGLSCFLLILLPPVLLMAALQWLVGDWLLGLGELVLALWALLFAHGPGQVDERIAQFQHAWRQGQTELARQALAELGEPAAQSTLRLPTAAVAAVLWQSYRTVFSAIFWLLLLGPVGPVLLRVAVLIGEFAEGRPGARPMLPVARAFVYALDWLPARATALSFGLAGSFVPAVHGWQAAREEPGAGVRPLVVDAGVGALRPEAPEDDPDSVEEMLQEARALVSRAFMIWLAVTALLTIAGWLY
jgi:membrane protein required for beta-lactamase induction